MRVTLVQSNPTVGDIRGNARAIEVAIDDAARAGSDLLVTSEMATLGYPPRDLVQREGVAQATLAAVEALAGRCRGLTALIGFVQPWPSGPRPFRNAVAACRNGRIEGIYAKRLLPSYDVFNEDRHFTPGDGPLVIDVAGERVGVLVCEDLWRGDDAGSVRRYVARPLDETKAAGATMLAVLSASPFVVGKDVLHARRLAEVGAHGLPLVSVNQVGGNDDLVFDGRSRAYGGRGLVAALAAFRAETRTVDLAGPIVADAAWPPEAEIVASLVLGIRDYLAKTGHTTALVGLSGGIDSALVVALAAMAIGPQNVTGVLMPSRHSSRGSIDDALDSARRLGLASAPTIPIEPLHAAFESAVAAVADVAGIADENVQSRVRGTILMTLSNATGAIVLTTGNKSEYATGYATLYGDMNGGLAPLGDVPKTMVYRIARWMNAEFASLGLACPPIPQSSIDKPPSAELRPQQTDQDTLPPYEHLDAIVESWIDREESIDAIAARTRLDRALVERWCRAIDRAQYKRDQAAVILKISPRAFGRGRAMPIAART